MAAGALEDEPMDLGDTLERLGPYLSLEERDSVAVVRCTDEFALLELNLELKGSLQRLFDAMSTSEEVGAVVVLGTERSFGGHVMDRFWHRVLEQGAGQGAPAHRGGVATTDFRRGEAGIHQLASHIRQCSKAVVITLQGEVVTPFLGASLVCDYRVAAEGTVFRNRAYEFAMPPGGALTYLLPAYVGFGRASELLLEGRDIAVAEALELGLVSRVVSPGELEGAALDVARRVAALPQEAVAAVKSLLTQSLVGLSAHFELETSLITRCMYRRDSQ